MIITKIPSKYYISLICFNILKTLIKLSFLVFLTGFFNTFNAQNQVVQLHNLGYISFLNKNYTDAINYYTQSINLDPTYVSNYLDRGMAYKENGQYKEAESDCIVVIKSGGEIAYQGYNNLGNLYRTQKKYNDALNNFNISISLNNQCMECYYNRAKTFEKLNDLEQAINDYSSVIKLNSSYSNAYYDRGNVKVKKKDYFGAINDYNKALTLESTSKHLIHYNRGMTYTYVKKYKEAKNDFEQYILTDNSNAEAYYNLAICCYNLNDLNNACIYANESLKLGYLSAKELIKASCEK